MLFLVRGGICEVFGLLWSQDLFPEEKMYCLDKGSQYASIAMHADLPLGPYKVFERTNYIDIICQHL
jgi:hypothetical protein